MSTLKALKTRIQAVNSTRKITSAMYMVAAAKFRKAQKKYDAAKSYADALTQVMKALPLSVFDESDNPLIKSHTVGQTLIVLISADRGLCGSFNGQLFRKAKEVCSKLFLENKPFTLLPIGKKAFEFATLNYAHCLKESAPLLLYDVLYSDVHTLFSKIETAFIQDGIEHCITLHNEYSSPLQQTPRDTMLLPLNTALKAVKSPEEEPTHIPEFVASETKFLDAFLQQYLHGILWSSITQTLVGEFAARMTAMDNATKNCDDMIHGLKLEYNQSRQARITNELIEIISGAEALQKG
ncbi:ATP synthase F1 subunit gamma [Candidatus Bodocaedibacter vickermanii]|uniref:ATP synthase gamma chain n=1 Tax=Candidatus Bodocaedibacter vickermanii TaxID=2741701 RepID=A0A7L9RV21_9PROT|nr:ATP synthase gamma chain [Candidatus Paracaedibacteraceae bacterium 'Lake Konstanz']